MNPDEWRSVRQDKSKPLVVALKTWLEQQLARVSAKATIAEQIRYGLNHWEGLTRPSTTAVSSVVEILWGWIAARSQTEWYW